MIESQYILDRRRECIEETKRRDEQQSRSYGSKVGEILQRAHDLLIDTEWIMTRDDLVCPKCFNEQYEGHKYGCEQVILPIDIYDLLNHE